MGEVIVTIARKFAWAEDASVTFQIRDEALPILYSARVKAPFIGRAESKGVKAQNVVHDFVDSFDQR